MWGWLLQPLSCRKLQAALTCAVLSSSITSCANIYLISLKSQGRIAEIVTMCLIGSQKCYFYKILYFLGQQIKLLQNQKFVLIVQYYFKCQTCRTCSIICCWGFFVTTSLIFTECSDFSPPVTVILMIFLCLEGFLFLTFTAVMFGTQIHSICNDETVKTLTFLYSIRFILGRCD